MEIHPFSVIAGLDPAIQVSEPMNLDHRVSPLRVGPVMTVLESVESEAGV
jgi:hypothetical protein